jgi:hypothetical protein
MVEDDQQQACAAARPEWPTSSPYVTSVGATQLTDKYLPICGEEYTVSGAYPGMPVANQLQFQCTGTAETVCTSTFGGVITSGGGFSTIAERNAVAPWQVSAVDAYLSAANADAYPPLNHFNPSGRGYPDVATYGSNYFVYLGGRITRESGTSASAPVFAAMVTLWNDMRLAYGMPPMGFIAPFLYYAHSVAPDAFQDITTGNNVRQFLRCMLIFGSYGVGAFCAVCIGVWRWSLDRDGELLRVLIRGVSRLGRRDRPGQPELPGAVEPGAEQRDGLPQPGRLPHRQRADRLQQRRRR